MNVLPDLLAPGLTTLFCGSAASAASARRGAPYAGPGNKFWPTLAESGLTPRRFRPEDWRELLAFGIGITDINKTGSGSDSDLDSAADDPARLDETLDMFRPRILAFTAKRPARVFLGHRFGQAAVPYGLQDRRAGDTIIFVLPSPSGLAVRWWDPRPWHLLAALHRALRHGDQMPPTTAL